ncbi:MAG: nodulation protein NfeD [Chloroflexi bacterium]|nr:MAG: nodulation protein NfeD [Chloroflexota bacterium]
MKRAIRLFLAAITMAALVPAVQARAAEPHVLVATLNGVINPITDSYISKAVDRAVSSRANALIIQMDTPGGLDTSMRDIIKKVLGAPLPVVVFVSPSGARAASAGLYITEAADIAAMAPGTNIGSAHPVSLGGSNPAASPAASPSASGATSAAPDIESQKIENDAAAYVRALATLHHRNADWAEKAVRQSINAPVDDAVKLGVVDLESRDLDTLLQDLDGRAVAKGGHTYTLQTARAGIERYDMSGFDQFLQAVADPNLVYLLFLLAIIGIGFWVTHPGLFLPGVIGVIAGILAALSLFDLPINIAGVLLILIAVVLFVIDLKAVTHGVLTTGGIVAMTLGGLLLINTSFLAEGVNIPLLIITVLVIAGIFLFILRKLIEARRRPYEAGEESMIGSVGTVREPLNPSGMVFTNGALWQATSTSGPLAAGAPVRVVGVDGLRLRVEALHQQQSLRADGPQAAS